jgi:uncharacterized protein (TIGR02118 family)
MEGVTGYSRIKWRIAMRVFKPAVVAASLLTSSVAFAGEVKITVLYNQPKSAEEFDKHYFTKHMPMVYAVKEIKKVEVARPTPSPSGAPSPYHIVTELWFDSPDALKTVAATPEWKAIVDDVPKFTEPGSVTIIVSEIEPKK